MNTIDLTNISGCLPIISLKYEYDKDKLSNRNLIIFRESTFRRDLELFSERFNFTLSNKSFSREGNMYFCLMEMA